MAIKGRPPKIDPTVLQLVKKLGNEGKSSIEIQNELFALGIDVSERTIRWHTAEEDVRKKIKEAAEDLLKKGALQTTIKLEIEQTAARKQWLLDQAAEIWQNIPKEEKNSARVFLKLIELAQKDSEMLFKVLGLPEPTSQDTQTLTKSLEQKLGL